MEIEKLIENDEKMINLGNERRWSGKLVQQLYEDLSGEEDTVDLMNSLTKIFQKEGSSKILEEVFEVLDQQLLFNDFALALSQ